jgi:hypothetical protein
MKNMSSGGCTVVEHSPQHLKVEGSSPANATGTGRENFDIKVTKNY